MTANPYDAPMEVSQSPREAPSARRLHEFDALPPLLEDRAFWGMTGTQFFGAFNDNVFKQLVLLLALEPVAVAGARTVSRDLQGSALFLFALPFILFSGIAGYYSERFSKKRVIVLSKAAEIVVMGAGVVVFLLYAAVGISPSSGMGLAGLFVVLFFMGAQSAFFGPGKFGILPEMLHPRDLPKANGIVLMSTFLAIIFGTALAGPCNDLFVKRLGQPWLASMVCVAIAVVGTGTSLLLRPTNPANRQLRFEWSALAIPGDVRRHLLKDRPLLVALLVSCMFWLVGGIAQAAINNLGKEQLLKGHPWADSWTSLLSASVGVGIAVGCVAAGIVSRGRTNFGLMRAGCAGTVLWLMLLCLPGHNGNLLGYWGSFVALLLLGVCTGFFIVPLQVFLQSRPPKGQKGRVIATMNLTNWIAILLSAVLYLVLQPALAAAHWSNGIFLFTALLMLPVAVFYRPKNEPLDHSTEIRSPQSPT